MVKEGSGLTSDVVKEAIEINAPLINKTQSKYAPEADPELGAKICRLKNRKNEKYSNGSYTGGRTEQELKALEEDPAHFGSTRPIDIEKGKHEAKIGLELEEKGSLKNITRDATGKSEFIDGNGQAWDVKSFNSNYKPNKGGFRLDKAMNTIKESLSKKENVIVDTSNMSPEHILELTTEIKNQELENNILFWP